MDDIWDITVEDVERFRQLLTPIVHTLLEPNPIVQPYVPLIPFPNEVKVIWEEEPNNDIDDKILNIIVVSEEDDFNPTREIEEIVRLIATDHESSFTKIKDTTARGRKFKITYACGYLGKKFANYNYGVVPPMDYAVVGLAYLKSLSFHLTTVYARMVISCKEAFQAELVGCLTDNDDDDDDDDDDELLVIVDVARGSRLGSCVRAW
nr:hypothetical protein [Tanacetum cinerariifolium]